MAQIITDADIFTADEANPSPEEIVDALKRRYPNLKRGQFVHAGGWDYPACPDPHRLILDDAFPDNPVILQQHGGHAMWMNTDALKGLGVLRRTKDPKYGSILRGPDGTPNGVVREFQSVRLTLEFARRILRKKFGYRQLQVALKLLGEAGITSVQDNT